MHGPDGNELGSWGRQTRQKTKQEEPRPETPKEPPARLWAMLLGPVLSWSTGDSLPSGKTRGLLMVEDGQHQVPPANQNGAIEFLLPRQLGPNLIVWSCQIFPALVGAMERPMEP